MKSSTLAILFVPVPVNYRDGRVHIVEHRYTAHREYVRVLERGEVCREWADNREAGEEPIIHCVEDGWKRLQSDWRTGKMNTDAHHQFGYWTLEANL